MSENKFNSLVPYELSGPEFLKRLQCEDALEGEPASLTCQVIGDPVPKIQWYREDNSEILPTDERYEMSYSLDDGKAQLTIKKAVRADEISYKCVASNEHGTSKTIGILVVKANKALKSHSPSPSRSLEPPTTSLKQRSCSPLRNIDVPPSNLQPVKEETEVSSSQSEDTNDNAKSQKSKTPEIEVLNNKNKKKTLKKGSIFFFFSSFPLL
jgi:hypothetical protein